MDRRRRTRRRRRLVLAAGSLLAGPPATLIAVTLIIAGAAACTSTGAGLADTPSSGAQQAIPAQLLPIFQQVGAQYRVPWEILAGIANEECSLGHSTDRSCTLQPSATGPGAANYAGASGLMQIGVGGAAGDEYDALRHYLPNPQLGPHDPTTAVQLAALVLTKDKRAPQDAPIDAYATAVAAYNGSGPQAQAYAQRVIADANSYHGTGQTELVAAHCAPAASPGHYANPFQHSSQLVPRRIDMGVDYDGAGPIDAVGTARITFAGTGIGGGWTCDEPTNGGVVYQLQDGPDKGRYVYLAEDIIPTTTTGQTVQAGQQIATFTTNDGRSCIETGWASGPGPGVDAEAAALNQQATTGDPGDNRSYCGQSFSDLLQSAGAPAGLTEGRPVVGTRC